VTNNGPIEESVAVFALVEFANGGELPEFMWRLAGAPRLLVPLPAPPGAVRNRLTGEPVAAKGRGSIGFDETAERALDAVRDDLRSDLGAIVAGRLTRARKKAIAAEADRVTVETSGAQRKLRPAFLRTPDWKAAVGYLLYLIATRHYGRRLARCKLDGCTRFFFREPRQARPECYCSTAHATKGKAVASKERSKNRRAVLEAIKVLKTRYPARAEQYVKSARGRGESVTADELVRRVEAAAKKRSL
jgi:hypothetical protein